MRLVVASQNFIPRVATPVVALSDSPDIPYTETQTIVYSDITCATPGATIFTRVTGGVVWEEWAVGSTIVLPVGGTKNVWVKAEKENLRPSGIRSYTYKVYAIPAAPTITPVYHEYGGGETTISTATPTAGLRYTTDGVTTPSATVGTYVNNYTAIKSIVTTTTVKAVAVQPNNVISAVTTQVVEVELPIPDIIITGTPLSPFSVMEGEPSADQMYSLEGRFLSYDIRITWPGGYELSLDGETYDDTGEMYIPYDYNGEINVRLTGATPGTFSGDIENKSEGADSEIVAVTGEVTLMPTVATPAISPEQGTYSEAQTISITCGTEGSTIRYTVNGSDPTSASQLYTTPITVDSPATIKAIAFKEYMHESPIATSAYDFVAATPEMSIPAGTYCDPQTISLSCVSEKSSIYYTLNGDTPTGGSTLYTTPIVIGETEAETIILKAIAIVDGWTDSAVASGTYVVTYIVDTPAIDPSTRDFYEPRDVSIACATPDAKIYYTTNGDVPDETDTQYAVPFEISATMTIKAKAFKEERTASGVDTSVLTRVDIPVFTVMLDDSDYLMWDDTDIVILQADA